MYSVLNIQEYIDTYNTYVGAITMKVDCKIEGE